MLNKPESVQKNTEHAPGKGILGASGHKKSLLTNEKTTRIGGRNFAPEEPRGKPRGKIVSLCDYAKSKGVKVMSRDEKEPKLEEFNPEDVSLFCDEMEEDNWALRAFGVLLESSSLDYFADEVTTAAS